VQTRPCAGADRPARDSLQRAGAPAAFPESSKHCVAQSVRTISTPAIERHRHGCAALIDQQPRRLAVSEMDYRRLPWVTAMPTIAAVRKWR
jgi:hypothetical protein